jgi:NAD(P)-dependent dehydrogenase (short-subunit alcohol dehydrogenase family)
MSGGKIVLITGVTRGLGRAMADEFTRLGHTVLGCGRSKFAIGQMGQSFGKPHDFSSVNVAQDAEVKSWANRLLNTFGPPDLLLNNAAIINRNAPLWRVSAQEFSDVVDINIKGVANVIRHFAPAMTAVRRGVIVNFSSGWGRSTDADVAPYCATKWAIEGLSGGCVQPRHHQHGNAPKLLRQFGVRPSPGTGMGEDGRAVPARPDREGKWQIHFRTVVVSSATS